MHVSLLPKPTQSQPFCAVSKICCGTTVIAALFAIGLLAKHCVHANEQGRDSGDMLAYLAWGIAGVLILSAFLNFFYSTCIKDRVPEEILCAGAPIVSEYNPV